MQESKSYFFVAFKAEVEVRVASEAKDEVIAASEGPVTLITNGPISLWPLNAASDSTDPSFNEFSQDPILLLRTSNLVRRSH